MRVSRLFEALLSRVQTDEELQVWTRNLHSGEKSLDQLVDSLAESAEFSELISDYFPEYSPGTEGGLIDWN
jgi:hypothetical protein